MALYLDNGYVNMKGIIEDDPSTFKFITGARGVGKTYGALLYCLENHLQFVLMRRTQSQIDMITNDDFSPFKPFAELGYQTRIHSIQKGLYGVYLPEEPKPIAYMLALSTISNLRGFSLPDVEIIIYDEFIPEPHARPIKEEGKAFLNAYETINRNRELQGKKPIQVLCLANSEDLANPIFIELQFVTVAEKMVNKGINKMMIPDRDTTLYILTNSRISEAKRNTALYKLAGSSTFSRMALDNDFTENRFVNISSEDLRQYVLIVVIGELAIYQHKSADRFYVTSHVKGSADIYDSSEMDQKRFRRNYAWLWFAHLRNEIFFESYMHLVLFEKYFGM